MKTLHTAQATGYRMVQVLMTISFCTVGASCIGNPQGYYPGSQRCKINLAYTRKLVQAMVGID